MSQEQPRRPSSGQAQAGGRGQDQRQEGGAIRYGDVFPAVTGDLAKKPVAPQDANTMQSAENLVLGKTLKGGPAATMQSAGTRNERMGIVGHDQATDAAEKMTIGEALEASGHADAMGDTKITIGEALEAAGYAAGSRPVERSDAAAIQAAEVRATGLAAQAQSAADVNAWAARDEEKAKLGDVLSNATAKLVADKEVETDDAARVAAAETRNKGGTTVRPGGIATSVAAAARLNKQDA